jgi:Xaa-Pro dipeptidase
MFSRNERETRFARIRQILIEDKLKAMLLIGDGNVSYGICGDFRYYTNSRVIFYRQAAVVFPDSDPVHFAQSDISRQAAVRWSFVTDCRTSPNLLAGITDLLKERGVTRGRIGVNFEMLPAAWHIQINRELPQVELVETHERIMGIRFQHSTEEANIYRHGAALGDGGFEAALRVIKPGVTDYEIVAEIEHYARRHGAEEHFTLIASGKFTLGEENRMPLVYAPTGRRIEFGDSVMMEITPRFEGYWTQLVRTVNVGKNNRDLAKLHEVCRGAIERGLEEFQQGKRIKDVAVGMQNYTSSRGYLPQLPLGHLCGIDLVEDRVSPENDFVLTPGMAVIIHPTVSSLNGKSSFFWGETYLLTESGCDRLHRATDELLTL